MVHIWHTSDELHFIDWLGTGTYQRSLSTPATRLAYLEGYQRGLALRQDWEGLNRGQIEEHVTNLIRSVKSSLPKTQGESFV